ncbi:hypothetical protein P154DRAFT_556518 [Amniculicola lignicola CBS 123094]|uniref:LamB/YcsF n=1 Tax=Amniculicola lignicola CBS 123094 TaxID=1392246 RepID=A0A6A5W4H2_9PLEO|nr:hypothetical protein P154DRAFT_556518 [Amniculicola lignicola CBS 123094]
MHVNEYVVMDMADYSRDPLIMHQTVLACKRHNIAVGVHPGLPDIQGFGCHAEGVELHHVKPHGILYGTMYRDKDTCRARYAGVPKETAAFGLAGTINEEVAKEMGLPFVAEIYDRKKKKPWHPDETQRHVRTQVENASVTAVSGEDIDLALGVYQVSPCCYSDSLSAVGIVTEVRQIVDEFNAEHFPQS